MSVSFTWEVVKPTRKRAFSHGTSDDIRALDEVFPGRRISTDELPKLRAMHAATRLRESLWQDILLRLESLQGEDYKGVYTIEVGTEF